MKPSAESLQTRNILLFWQGLSSRRGFFDQVKSYFIKVDRILYSESLCNMASEMPAQDVAASTSSSPSSPSHKSQQHGADLANLKQARILMKEANVLEEWVDCAGAAPKHLQSTEALAKVVTKLRKLATAVDKLAAIPETTSAARPADIFDDTDVASRCAAAGLAFCRDVVKAAPKNKWDDPEGMVGIAINFGLVEAAIMCIRSLPKRKTLCAAGLLCLSAVALCKPDLRDYIMGELASSLAKVFKMHRTDVPITTNAMKLSRILCSNSGARQEIFVQSSALTRVVRCIEEHLKIASIQAESARLLGNMAAFTGKSKRAIMSKSACKHPFAESLRERVVAIGGVKLCKEALETHPGDEQVVEWTCGAIANMSNKNCELGFGIF